MSTNPDAIQEFDEERADNYDDRIRRVAAGYDLLHATVGSTLEARLGEDASILLAGVGTGEELVRLAELRDDWSFAAVDPSEPMLERCRERIQAAKLEDRVDLIAATVEHADVEADFDAATSIFVSHFIDDVDAKRAYFASIAEALRPGGTLVTADLFAPGDGDAYESLMAAWKRHTVRSGLPEADADEAFENVRREISFVEEGELRTMLGEAEFDDISRFFQCFVWGAWTAVRI